MRRLVAAVVLLAAVLPAQRGFPGILFVCGGGALPDEVLATFVTLAGGPAARLVVIPTASADADGPDAAEEFAAPWRARGIGDVQVLHTRDRAAADDPAFVAPLARATAVWLGGGAQARLAEAYGGTRVEHALRAVLARGGLVGGTSAGAAIQSRTMIASGNPDPRIRPGLGLLDDLIVDQHFRQRGREPRLRVAVQRHPDRIGVGIDEGTALVVSGARALVLGSGCVTVVLPGDDASPTRETLHAREAELDLAALRAAARSAR